MFCYNTILSPLRYTRTCLQDDAGGQRIPEACAAPGRWLLVADEAQVGTRHALVASDNGAFATHHIAHSLSVSLNAAHR